MMAGRHMALMMSPGVASAALCRANGYNCCAHKIPRDNVYNILVEAIVCELIAGTP